jgi:protein-S-isoprenylcysteine O-methyltransferase Ste14
MNAPLRLAIPVALGLLAALVFRRVDRDYRRRGRLGPASILLECVVFGLHGLAAFPMLDIGIDRLPEPGPRPAAAAVLLAAGLLGTLVAMSRLGWGASLGNRPEGLRTRGLYRHSRNPQLVAYTLAVAGAALLRPGWPALLWLAAYVVIAGLMVRAEEAHLSRLYGDAYARYRAITPRYVGRRRAG